MSRFGLPFCLALLLSGCVQPVSPPSKPAAQADYFEALAEDLPDQSDELAWIVQKLAQDGRLSERDVHDFHTAFPDVQSKSRPLTDNDRATLRGLR